MSQKPLPPADVLFAQQIVDSMHDEKQKTSAFYQNSMRIVVEWKLQQLSKSQLYEVITLSQPTGSSMVNLEKISFTSFLKDFTSKYDVLDFIIQFVQSLVGTEDQE